MRTPLLLSVLALMVAAPATLVACSHDDSTSTADNNATSAENPDKGDEGSVCWKTEECADGLLCKKRPSGPPPGALGLPVPSSSATHHSGPPPGAMGMPLPPNTCQRPAPGEEGSECHGASDCNDGLVCESDVPAGSSSGHAFPPGAMGMPIRPTGKCTQDDSSSGPPPGAMGLPIHH